MEFNEERRFPNGFTVIKNQSSMIITKKWLSKSTLFITCFTIYWNVSVFNEYSSVSTISDLPWLYLSVGLFLVYFCLACWLNKSTFKVSEKSLSISHGPLPWFGNKKIETRLIKQLFVKEVTSLHTSTTYELLGIYWSGQQVKLLVGLDDAGPARFLEKEIEEYLNINDEPVEGEVKDFFDI
ncbi:TPA: hypothetical protein I7774_22165 [Vibrio vulnificus]|nr:hypothetical protein [Vibrio vulnificus]